MLFHKLIWSIDWKLLDFDALPFRFQNCWRKFKWIFVCGVSSILVQLLVLSYTSIWARRLVLQLIFVRKYISSFGFPYSFSLFARCANQIGQKWRTNLTECYVTELLKFFMSLIVKINFWKYPITWITDICKPSIYSIIWFGFGLYRNARSTMVNGDCTSIFFFFYWKLSANEIVAKFECLFSFFFSLNSRKLIFISVWGSNDRNLSCFMCICVFKWLWIFEF